MAACVKCGAPLVEGAVFCGSCGTPATATSTAGGGATAPAAASSGLAPNVAGMLAYFTIIPAILFLVMEPYNKDKFVRFHAFQSLFFNIAWIVVWVGMIIFGTVLAFMPVVGWALHLLIDLVIWIGGFVLWLILVFKAYSNEKFQLPVIGKIAEDQAAK